MTKKPASLSAAATDVCPPLPVPVCSAVPLPQPANTVANIKRVVFPVGETTPMAVQARPLRSLIAGVRARSKRVKRLFVGRVDGDVDAVEGDERIKNLLSY